jgi:hypothetical protein
MEQGKFFSEQGICVISAGGRRSGVGRLLVAGEEAGR